MPMGDVEVQLRSPTRPREPGAPPPRGRELFGRIISVLCKLGRAAVRLRRGGRNAFNEDSDDIAATPFARCGADVTPAGEPAEGGGRRSPVVSANLPEWLLWSGHVRSSPQRCSVGPDRRS